MTEEEFAAAQEAQKEEGNPFAGLQGFLIDDLVKILKMIWEFEIICYTKYKRK